MGIFKVQTKRAESLVASELILNKTSDFNSTSLSHHEQEVDFKLSQLTKELSLLKDKLNDHSKVNENHRDRRVSVFMQLPKIFGEFSG